MFLDKKVVWSFFQNTGRWWFRASSGPRCPAAPCRHHLKFSIKGWHADTTPINKGRATFQRVTQADARLTHLLPTWRVPVLYFVPLATEAEFYSQLDNFLHSDFISLYYRTTGKYRGRKPWIFVKIQPLLPYYCCASGTYRLNFRENSSVNNVLSALQAYEKSDSSLNIIFYPLTSQLPPLNCQLSTVNYQLSVCQPCVSLCHPLKRCTPFIYRDCVSVSALFAKTNVCILSRQTSTFL